MSHDPSHSNSRRLDVASDDVDNASLDSFPASDPPKWSTLRLGPPVDVPTAAAEDEKESTSVPTRSRVRAEQSSAARGRE
jgi:hypothetical protein